MRTKHFMGLVGLLSVTLFLLLVALTVKGQAEDVIKVGVIGPFKSPPGAGIENGANMAADEINRAGGILGKKIELILSDDMYNPETGATGYKKLALQDKAAVVIGTASSGVALAVLDQMARYKVPFFATGGATPALTAKVEQDYTKYKYFFRICHSSLEMADITTDWIINFLAKEKKLKRVGLMIETAVWTKPIAEKWNKDLLSAGIEVPVFEYFDMDTKDFKPIFNKIVSSKCEAICVLSSHVDAATYINQWASLKGPIIAGITGSSSTVWDATRGKVLSMVEMGHPVSARLTHNNRVFYDNYVKKFGRTPEYTAPYTYDSLYILKNAIEKAKSTDPDAIVAAMEKTDYDGATARWVFDKKSHHSKFGPGFRQMLMTQWQGSDRTTVIWPPNLAQKDFIYPPWYNK